MTTESNTNLTIVRPDFKNAKNEEMDAIKSILTSTVDSLKNSVETADPPVKSIIVISFDADGTPHLDMAGKIDPIENIGFLRLVEADLMGLVYSYDASGDPDA